MSTPLTKDTKIVLKLDLGEDGLRRIPLHKLWDESTNSVSYERLVGLIIDFKQLRPKAVQNQRVSVSTTYMDEDGDEITISSNSELIDAFTQFADVKPPVLRAKAIIVKNKKDDMPKKEERKELKKGVNKMQLKEKMKAQKKEIKIENKKLAERKNQPPIRVPTITVPGIATFPAVAPQKPIVEAFKVPGEDGYLCDPNFIHGRHTCDSCLTTPIFGLRYHAINLPDYDLCSNCHQNYSGKDIVFKPMELDRDRHLQARWKRRYRRRCRLTSQESKTPKTLCIPQIASGTQTKKVIDGLDDDLKEAIRLSMIDAMNDTCKNVEKASSDEEVASSVDATETIKEEREIPDAATVTTSEEEEDIPVAATVLSIEAGNEETQRTLDNMNPVVKEALRKKLNAFFARRANPSEAQVDGETNASSLSHDLDTQRKIDAMDPLTKKAISRKLNEFFANRRATKGEAEKDSISTEENDDNDDAKRTKEILDSMNEEKKELLRKSLHDFFARRAKNLDSKDTEEDNTEKNEVPSVIIDIVVDDDLSVGDASANADAEGDSDTMEEIDTDISESSASKDDWQMVSDDSEMIAVAAQMLGSALFESDCSSTTFDSNHK